MSKTLMVCTLKLVCIVLVSFVMVTPGHAALTAWEHDWLTFMDDTTSVPENPDTLLFIRVTPGEYEPVSFAVRTEETTSLTVTYVTGGDYPALPESWVKIQHVDRRTDTTTVKWLYEIESAVEVQAQTTTFFWITLHPPEDATPGNYAGTVELQSGTGSRVLALQCEILPFLLEETPIKLATYTNRTDLPQKVFLDMKEHGLDGIWVPWGNACGITVTNVEDELVLDFSILNSTMQKFQASGMKGPVHIMLGNAWETTYEIFLARSFGLPIDEYDDDWIVNGDIWRSAEITAARISPELDSLFVEGLRQIRDHWNSNYPEIELTMMIHDEQAHFFLDRHRTRYNLLKTVMPDIRVEWTCMSGAYSAEQIEEQSKDQSDIFVAAENILAIRELARETGKDFWIFGGPIGRDPRTGQGPFSAVHASRNLMGLMAWAAEAEVSWFWAFNWWNVPDPDNEIMIYPYPEPDDPLWYVWDGDRRMPLDALEFMSSTPWEGVREGWDDLRYLATAEKVISEAGAEKKAWAENKLSAIFDEMRSLSCFVEGGTLWMQPLCALPSSRMHEIREELIEIITTIGVPECVLKMDSVAAPVGEDVAVALFYDSEKAIAGLSLTLNFDPAEVGVSSVELVGEASSMYLVGLDLDGANESGLLKLSLLDFSLSNPIPPGSGAIIQVEFWDEAKTVRIVALELSEVFASGSSAESISLSVKNGLIVFLEGEERSCDFNGDGMINIADVVAFLLLARDNPNDPRVDWNGDGRYMINDAIILLLDIMYGTCPDAGVLLASATENGYLEVGKIEGLSRADIEYVERMMAQMNLTPEQEAAFRLALYGQAGVASLPKAFSLAQSVPNPFNPTTTIAYGVPEGTSIHVTLKVYDLRGRLVRTLVDEVREPGTYTVFWDGRDGSGRQVSSGVYLYRMQAGNFVQTRKMILLK